MERCREASKQVSVYHTHRGVAWCFGACDTTQVTQKVCVSGNGDGVTLNAKLDRAVESWKNITRVDAMKPVPFINWYPQLNWYARIYPIKADGNLGLSEETLWK